MKTGAVLKMCGSGLRKILIGPNKLVYMWRYETGM